MYMIYRYIIKPNKLVFVRCLALKKKSNVMTFIHFNYDLNIQILFEPLYIQHSIKIYAHTVDFVVSVSSDYRLTCTKPYKLLFVCTNLNDQILHLNMDLNVSIIQRRYYISKLANFKCSTYYKRVTSFQVQSHIFHLIILSLCNIEKSLELVRQLASRTRAQIMNLSGVIHGEILL